MTGLLGLILLLLLPALAGILGESVIWSKDFMSKTRSEGRPPAKKSAKVKPT
jgi:hypothetical protein